MKKEILALINSLREKSAGKTCMGTGNFSFDIITQREYPDGFVVGKRNRFEEKILKMEIGNTCGNVMTMLPYLGVKTWMERPRKEEERIHHIPGPQFEPMGTLNRVPQPNTNRNQTLMEQWNQSIAPGDTVYVDGDFGAEEWKTFLNGNIKGGRQF